MPGRGINMGDGWETKRRRGPGYDWCVILLAAPGVVQRVLIDTNWFKGNFPDAASIEGTVLSQNQGLEQAKWIDVLPRTPLGPHKEHIFTALKSAGPFTHLRVNMYPDGGISRIRVFGTRSVLPPNSKL